MANIAYNRGRALGFVWDPIANRSVLPNNPSLGGYTVHMTAVRAPDIYGPGKGPGGTYAHYHMPRSGPGRQHQDLHHRAYADLDDNGDEIAAETEGVSGDWMTEDQLDAHARGFADAVLHRGVANRIATPKDTRGLRWHRLGIKGNFRPFDPDDMTTWTGSQTGERWTKHFGKTCPTDNFIRQIPEIYRRAQPYIKAGSSAGTILNPTPAAPRDWFDTVDEKTMRKMLADSEDRTVEKWLDRRLKISGSLSNYLGGKKDANLQSLSLYSANSFSDGRNFYAELRAQLAGLQAAMGELAKGQGVDADRIDKAINKAVADALADLKITLTTEG